MKCSAPGGHRPARGRRWISIYVCAGLVASAAACASMLRDDAALATNAMAIACALGMGLKEFDHSPKSQPITVACGCESGPGCDALRGTGRRGCGLDHRERAPAVPRRMRRPGDYPARTRHRGPDIETYIKVHGGGRGQSTPHRCRSGRDGSNRIAAEDIVRSRCGWTVTYASDIDERQTEAGAVQRRASLLLWHRER